MFTLYQSNQISALAKMLVQVQQVSPIANPFTAEIILIQSQGMAQWLQMQIAEETGIMGNCEFLYPTTFLWQQYRLLFPNLPKENVFDRQLMTWRIMRLLPNCLTQAEFAPLARYLAEAKASEQYQLKCHQLAAKIAELFDQYLVYRPHWLVHWEKGELQAVEKEIKFANPHAPDLIFADMRWQSALWNQLIADLKAESSETAFLTSHRAYLQQNYFEKLDRLTPDEKAKLPQRIFIFGISSFSPLQLAVFKKLSEHCDIHIFFLNPSEKYWGDSVEDRVWQNLALSHKISAEELDNLLAEKSNQLLTLWGKQGRDFLAQLTALEPNTIDAFVAPSGEDNLSKLKQQIFALENQATITELSADRSIQIHACHSPMREVEVLHNQLLNLFAQDSTLLPKDIIVMSPDINQYAPYIDAVFSRYQPHYHNGERDPRYIPFSLSDQAFTQIDPILASFSQLLAMKESPFNAESLLDLLDVKAIQARFNLSEEHIHTLRRWVKEAGVRSGIHIAQPHWQNYTTWENGLNRLLLGASLKEENGIWQDTLAFGDSYGLSAELVGQLATFISQLTAWVAFIQQPHSLAEWHLAVKNLIQALYQDNAETSASLLLLDSVNEQIVEQLTSTHFDEPLGIELVALLFSQQLNTHSQNLNFLVGRVNFATLLPMRAIPFKVVCLLGMNEADFPRQPSPNSFDLMQYAPQKGDRAKRDDDRYLFLEALLSAQKVFYVSYVGQSQKDGKAKLPSIVVSQLLDTLNDYLTPELKQALNGKTAAEALVRKHPLTVFSPKNFTHPTDAAYNAEWVLNAPTLRHDFLAQPLPAHSAPVESLEVSELILFLQNPVKYFFRQVLGVSFEYNDERIEESEIFAMSALDDYAILDDLLNVDEQEQALFFEKEQRKGNLPAAHFAEMATQTLVAKIAEMRRSLAPYLRQESQHFTLNESFKWSEKTVQLTANFTNLYGNDLIFWRVGGLRDKDRIQAWVYHLLAARYFPHIKVQFYYRNGEQTGLLRFEQISPAEAEAQLAVYLNAYFDGFSQPQLVIYDKLADYFDKKSPDVAKIIDALAESREGRYLSRILAQSDLEPEKYPEIAERTTAWFGLMWQKMPLDAE